MTHTFIRDTTRQWGHTCTDGARVGWVSRSGSRVRPVLSIGKLAPGRADYYLGTVANGVEDYYTGAGEAPGEWVGLSAERLGLSGQVDAESLHRVLEHTDPASGARLTTGSSTPTVPGYDTTFCAPKSVSLLFGLGDPEISNQVRNAHDAAVQRALAVYETMARGRRGAGGHQSVDGEGFVGAAFRHQTSRNLDPHLHTHVVVANLVYAEEDGRWSAIDGRPIYQWCRTIGHLYNAQLRHELTARLGVEWTPVENGLADIVGVPRHVIEAFSTRSDEIRDDLETHGMSGAKAAQMAVYMTRADKSRDLDGADLVQRWRTQATELGFDATSVERTLRRRPLSAALEPGAIEADRNLYRRLAGPQGLTEHASTFGRREVIGAICDELPAGARIEDVLDLVEDFLASGHVVGLGQHGGAPLHRRNGSLVPSGSDVFRFSTPDMIEVEQRLLASVARRQDDGAGVAQPQAIDLALRGRLTITDEQAAMVRRVCSSGAGVDLVEGVAGSGKTFALAAARDEWTASGFSVSGLCLAARTARRLEEGTGIPSTTLDMLLTRLKHERLSDRDVIVVDEAAMVGTRKLERLFAHAETAGAKVVLIGDPCQLPEIDAGGAFAGIARRFGSVELSDNRRQHQAWERDALAQLRNGDPDTAIDAFVDRDRVHLAETVAELRADLVGAWWRALRDGQHALMCAPTRRQVDDLNILARRQLRAVGEIYGEDHRIGRHDFAVGDRVLGLRNDRRLGILNGDDAIVARIDPRRRELTVIGETGTIRLPYDYAEEWLTHAYATTIHKAQGATVDATFVLADDTVRRQHLYTALSRGRESNNLYVTTADWRDDIRHAPELELDPMEGLRNSAQRDASQQLAVESDDRLVPASVLRAEENRLWRILATGPVDRTLDLQRVTSDLRSLRRQLAEATDQRDDAVAQLEDMGPVERRLHRKTRTRLEHQVAEVGTSIDRLESMITEWSTAANGYSADIRRRRAWEAEHEPDRARLDAVQGVLRSRPEPSRELGTRALERDDPGLGL